MTDKLTETAELSPFATLLAKLEATEKSRDTVLIYDAGYYLGVFREILPIWQLTQKTPGIARNLDEANPLPEERARAVCLRYLHDFGEEGILGEIVKELLKLTSRTAAQS